MDNENNSGIKLCSENHDLVIKRNGETIITAEDLYSIVFDLLSVDCSLPEDWPHIRQRFCAERGTFEIAIGAESLNQISQELIDDESYIRQLRPGEYFIESVIDPQKFTGIIRHKLAGLGLSEGRDFSVLYNRRLGQISVILSEKC